MFSLSKTLKIYAGVLQVEFPLPLIGATDLDDWPGGVRQQFKAARPMVDNILGTLPVRTLFLLLRTPCVNFFCNQCALFNS